MSFLKAAFYGGRSQISFGGAMVSAGEVSSHRLILVGHPGSADTNVPRTRHLTSLSGVSCQTKSGLLRDTEHLRLPRDRKFKADLSLMRNGLRGAASLLGQGGRLWQAA